MLLNTSILTPRLFPIHSSCFLFSAGIIFTFFPSHNLLPHPLTILPSISLSLSLSLSLSYHQHALSLSFSLLRVSSPRHFISIFLHFTRPPSLSFPSLASINSPRHSSLTPRQHAVTPTALCETKYTVVLGNISLESIHKASKTFSCSYLQHFPFSSFSFDFLVRRFIPYIFSLSLSLSRFIQCVVLPVTYFPFGGRVALGSVYQLGARGFIFLFSCSFLPKSEE